jgi:hypothetical protein
MFDNEKMTADTGGNFVLAPAGNHIARLCSMIEIGTVDGEGTNEKGQKFHTHSRRIMLGFELIGKEHIFDESKGLEPFVITKEYTYKVSKKSTLGKELKAWLSNDMPWLVECKPDDVKKFNLITLLGKEIGKGAIVMVNVVHGKKEDGSDKAEIAGLTPVPKEMIPQVALGKVKQTLFNFNLPFKKDVFNALPAFLQKKIKTSDEYLKLVGADPNVVAAASSTPVQTTAGKIETPVGGEDLPF